MLIKLLLFVHIMGAIMWIGGGWIFQLFTERAVATDDPGKMKGLMDYGERLGKSYFGPLSGVVLASGIGLVLSDDWGFGHPFIIGGLVGLVVSAVLGAAVIGPTVSKIRAALDSSSAAATESIRNLRRLRDIGRLDIAVTTTVVFLMTFKPGS